MSDLYNRVLQLTEEQRAQARSGAQAQIAGKIPSEPNYDALIDNRFPPLVMKSINLFTDAVILCAFVPSALRIFLAGGAAFFASTHSSSLAALVGVTSVALAEIGQLVFMLARLIVNERNTLKIGKYAVNTDGFVLTLAALACTAYALVGNILIAQPQSHNLGVYGWLETLLPPLLVLSAAHVRKASVLHTIEVREAAKRTYQFDLATWQDAYDQAPQHANWTSIYANAIRDNIVKVAAAGRSKDERKAEKKALLALSNDDWRLLILRELQADNWYADAEARALAADQARQDHEAQMMEENLRLRAVVEDLELELELAREAASVAPKRSGASSGERNGTSGSMVFPQGGRWHVKPCECGETFEKDYSSATSAQNAYSGHLRKSAKHAAYTADAFSANGQGGA